MKDYRKDHPNLTTIFSAAAAVGVTGLATANPVLAIAGGATAGAVGLVAVADIAIKKAWNSMTGGWL